MSGPVTILCANLKGNLGDFAILEIMGRSLKRHFPDIEIGYFYHANKPIDKPRYARFLQELDVEMTDLGPAPFVSRPSWFRLLSKLPGTGKLVVRIHNALIDRVADKVCTDTQFSNVVEKSRLVLFAGGSQWGKANLNLNMFAQLACVSRHGTPVGVFPFGISRVAFDCNGPQKLISMLSALHQPIPVRDVISHRLLTRAGLPTTHVSDCVFTARDLFSSLRDSPPERTRKVYVSVTRSGQTTPQSIVGLFEQLRAAELEPILFSSCEYEDRPLLDAVLEIDEATVEAPDSWKTAVQLFAGAAFVITNRLHCLIFSALAGCAVIPVTNRQKAEAYAEDADLRYAPREIAQIDTASIHEFIAGLDDVRSKQIAFLNQSAEITESVIEQIVALTEG
jgi:polysaccharide pyruvyl transferase WcaK-like protein